MTLGDRIVIMKDGVIQQIGTPQQVFDSPANLFVAGFIGVPQMNMFDGKLEKKDGKYYVELGDAKVELSEDKQKRLTANGIDSQDVTVGVRPEHIEVHEEKGATIHGTVDVSEMMGSAVHLHLRALGRDTIIIVPTIDLSGEQRANFAAGKDVEFTFEGNCVHVFDPKSGRNLEF